MTRTWALRRSGRQSGVASIVICQTEFAVYLPICQPGPGMNFRAQRGCESISFTPGGNSVTVLCRSVAFTTRQADAAFLL